VLVSAIGGDIGQAIARVLEEDFFRVGCDMREFPPHSKFVEKFVRIPGADQEGPYLEAILETIDSERIDYFIPVSEPELQLLNRNRRLLDGSGAHILMNNEFILTTFLDKLLTAEFLVKHGLPAPQTIRLTDFRGQFDPPFIVKHRQTWGGRRVWTVSDDDDLSYLRKKDDGGLIAQELIGNEEEEFTTGVFSDGGSVSTITFRRSLGMGGLSREVVLERNPSIQGLAESLATATGLQGSLNIQSRRVGDTFVPFEVNPRISSTVTFRKEFGFDDTRWWIDSFEGKQHSYPNEFKSGYAFRYLAEAYLRME